MTDSPRKQTDAVSAHPELTRPLQVSRTSTYVVGNALETRRCYLKSVEFLLSQLRTEHKGATFANSKVRGRVLESALLLHILRRDGLRQSYQTRLQRFLEANIHDTDPFSGLIASAVLGHDPRNIAGTLREMLGNLEYAKSRKQALLKILLVEVGLLRLSDAELQPEDFADRAVHRFSRLYCAAMRVMFVRHGGTLASVDGELDYLASAQATNGSWEQQALITLTAMCAFDSAHPCYLRGLRFLESLEREDGGIPFCDNQNIWVTALTCLALQAGGFQSDLLAQIGDYIASRQQANGGWCFTEGVVQTDTDDTANCAQALIQLDPVKYAGAIARSLDYFESLQCKNGGYPTYEVEGEAEVTMTANIVVAQSLCAAQHLRVIPAIQRAAEHLVARQKSDGRFEKSWSLCESYSIFRVLWALDACEHLVTLSFTQTRARAVHYLLSSQNSDGGWGQDRAQPSDALSTAYAVAALSLLRRTLALVEAPLSRGVRFLISKQNPRTGEISAIPDVAGPRPIVFDTPLLSTVFSAMSLGLLCAKSADWADPAILDMRAAGEIECKDPLAGAPIQ